MTSEERGSAQRTRTSAERSRYNFVQRKYTASTGQGHSVPDCRVNAYPALGIYRYVTANDDLPMQRALRLISGLSMFCPRGNRQSPTALPRALAPDPPPSSGKKATFPKNHRFSPLGSVHALKPTGMRHLEGNNSEGSRAHARHSAPARGRVGAWFF